MRFETWLTIFRQSRRIDWINRHRLDIFRDARADVKSLIAAEHDKLLSLLLEAGY